MDTKIVREFETTTVELSPRLAEQAKTIARRQHWSMSKALRYLLECGAEAQHDAEATLADRHRQFMQAQDSSLEAETGKQLIRAIFGPASIA